MQIIAIIPARYASTRFPGKPLIMLGGKSMLQRVVEQLRKTAAISRIVVATDDERISSHAAGFGAEVVMTSPDHPSGTDRCAEALQKLGGNYDIVINVQGDEPFIQPAQLDALAAAFADEKVQIATLVKALHENTELFNPNIVKVVRGADNRAIYFSRQAIPYLRGTETGSWASQHTFYRHLGVYAYRAGILPMLTRLSPSPLEKAESLEQLRWLENGFLISTVTTDFQSLAVDTPDDVQNVENFLQQHPHYL